MRVGEYTNLLQSTSTNPRAQGRRHAVLRQGHSLGTVGTFDDLSTGQKVIDEAIKQGSSLRGRLGAFQKNTVGSTINSLGIALENTAAAESSIRDTDFAAETAELTRAQILAAAGTSVLATANLTSQNVLALLG